MSQRMIIGLVLAILAQFLILTGMVVKAAIPLWTGETVIVKVAPVDPRSLFRGNYARLEYEFSEVESSRLTDVENLRVGERVYVTLALGEEGHFEMNEVALAEPTGGIYLSGRLQNRYSRSVDTIRIRYGIEAYFASKERAIAIERELAGGAFALLKVTRDGQARISGIVADITDYPEI